MAHIVPECRARSYSYKIAIRRLHGEPVVEPVEPPAPDPFGFWLAEVRSYFHLFPESVEPVVPADKVLTENEAKAYAVGIATAKKMTAKKLAAFIKRLFVISCGYF